MIARRVKSTLKLHRFEPAAQRRGRQTPSSCSCGFRGEFIPQDDLSTTTEATEEAGTPMPPEPRSRAGLMFAAGGPHASLCFNLREL